MNRDQSTLEPVNADTTKRNLHDARESYEMGALLECDAPADPFELFLQWFQAATNTPEIKEANAMTLATADAAGRPSARTVLLKEYSEAGFVFYTNYASRKGQDLAENPQGALLFWWPPLERQIRLEGVVEKVSAEQSDQYFHSRPIGSQIGATASPQSKPISGREELEFTFAKIGAAWHDQTALRPANWGGYVLVPSHFEFWQGRPNRLHDRLAYSLREKDWHMQRLAP